MKKIYLVTLLLISLVVIFAASSSVYSQAGSTVTKHPAVSTIEDLPGGQINLGGTTDHLYHFTGNLNIDSPADITGNKTGVIFVDGDLTIGPIPSGKLEHGTANSGLVFVVKGDVQIEADVTEINAVLIAEGTIYTEGAGCAISSDPPGSQLTINGSLISLNPDKPIQFCRSLTDNSNPAEVINHQVKYLVILRHLLSDTYQKWSEIP